MELIPDYEILEDINDNEKTLFLEWLKSEMIEEEQVMSEAHELLDSNTNS